MEELYLLGHQQGTEFRGKAFDEILVREHGCTRTHNPWREFHRRLDG
jgi:hypothetical protein